MMGNYSDTADDVVSIPSKTSIILDLPPSCIEFSPFHQNYFIVGTYYLEPESGASHTTFIQQQDDKIRRPPQDRKGSLTLFHLDDGKL